MLQIDEGIILNIYNQNGKKKIIILTNNNGLHLFDLQDINIFPNNYQIFDYWTLIFYQTSTHQIKCLPHTKITNFLKINNLKSKYYALNFTKLIIKNYKKQQNKLFFAFLLELYKVIFITKNLAKVYTYFLFHSLWMQGIQFNLTYCSNCGNKKKLVYLDYINIEIYCQDCLLILNKNSKLNFINIIYELNALYYQEIDKWIISDIELNNFTKFLKSYCTYFGILSYI